MFVNTRYFSPVVLEGITEAPPDTYEWSDWWDIQYDRCLNGYKVGNTKITGPHYFYLNFWPIKALPWHKPGKRKIITAPRFLDIDYEFFWEVEKARTQGKNLIIAKKRQCGHSEKAGCLMGHEFTFYPASQTAVVAGEEKYAENTFGFMYRGLNRLADTEFYKERHPDDIGGMHIKAQKKNEKTGQWEGYMSEVFGFTARTNSEVLSRLSPSFVVYEETGRFPLAPDVEGKVRPSQETAGEDGIPIRTGWGLFIGTGGDMADGLDAASNLFYSPDSYEAMEYENEYSNDPEKKKISYFVPGWKFHIIDKDGNSLEKESREDIAKRREKAAKSRNRRDLIKEIIARPMNPDEIYMIITDCRFNQVALNQQRARIMNNSKLASLPSQIDLHWIYDGIPKPGRLEGDIIGIEYVQDPNGPYTIIEFPERDEEGNVLDQYFGGTDSYDRDEANTSDSKGSTSIFNGRKKMFSARVTARPSKASTFFEYSAKLNYFYGCKNLIEWSNILIFDWYEHAGLLWMLKERPRLVYANVKDSKASNKYGVDPSTKPFWIRAYADHIDDHADKMYDSVQVSRALVYNDDVNCDITISSSLAHINYMDSIEFIDQPTTLEEKKDYLHFKTTNNMLISSMN